MIIATALLPVAILAFYIYRKDNQRPEPAWQLIKGFLLGAVSCPLSFCISVPLLAMGLYTLESTTFSGGIAYSFFGAAIPEECAKLFMLWLLLRKNKHFDENMDGIVYAVCVSLGFAAVENVVYLFGNYTEWLSVGVSRAIFSIPGHFGFGILMGYYYSLVKFCSHDITKHKLLVISAPVLMHGMYNSILAAMSISPELSGTLMLVFLLFCHKLWKYGSARIAAHLDRDRTGQPIP